MLIFDLKIISKSLATRVKKFLSNLIHAKQTAYVYDRFIDDCGRLIYDVIKVCDIQKISGYLLAVDFGKIFDSKATLQNISVQNVLLDKVIQLQHIYLYLHYLSKILQKYSWN